MRRFHKPRDVERSIVVVRSEGYGDWLDCRSAEKARSFLQAFPTDGHCRLSEAGSHQA